MRSAFETVDGRRGAHDEIDGHLAAWTETQSKVAVTSALQMFGVPVAPMLTGSEQARDPHFQARGFPRWIEQQELGWIAMEGPAFQASGMSDVVTRQAPLLGEHTRAVCRELLELPDAEIEELVEAGDRDASRGGNLGEDEPWWRLIGNPLVAVSAIPGGAALQFRHDNDNPRIVEIVLEAGALRVALRPFEKAQS